MWFYCPPRHAVPLLGHAELVSASHREPSLIVLREPFLALLRGQILKRVQDDIMHKDDGFSTRHAELVSASHREPSLTLYREPCLTVLRGPSRAVLRGQILKQVQDDV